jgi:DNA-binding MarR family transcriptional regulator
MSSRPLMRDACAGSGTVASVPRELDAPPLSYALTRLARQISRSLADVQIEDLTGPQLVALLTLEHEPGLSNAQLARRCFVSAQAMSEVVLDLERRRLLTREPDPLNQRIRRAHVTPAGRKLIRATEKRILALENQLLDGFSSRDEQRFRRSVAQAARNLGLPSAEAESVEG